MKTKIQRLIELNSKLDGVINFALKIDDDDDSSSIGGALKTGAAVTGAGALGLGGLYAVGARRQGTQWANMGSKVARDIGRGGLIGSGGIGSTISRGAKFSGQVAGNIGKSAWEALKGIRVG